MSAISWLGPLFWKWTRRTSQWILAWALIVLGCGFVAFPIMIGRLPEPSMSEKTDGLVIFTGEKEREHTAWRLFRKGLAPKFHISGRHRGFHAYAYPPNVTIDFAPTTEKNVQMTHRWIQKNHIRSVRLVTSDYHMPRCALLASHFWKGVKIIPHPVHIPHSSARHPMLKILAEYARYVGTMMLSWMR